MDKKLKQLRKLYEKYDASVEASPYYRYVTLAQQSGNTEAALKIAKSILEGGLSFVPYDNEGALIGKDENGRKYGRPSIDEAVVLINRQMKRSGVYDEDKYWIELIDSKGNPLLHLTSDGQPIK